MSADLEFIKQQLLALNSELKTISDIDKKLALQKQTLDRLDQTVLNLETTITNTVLKSKDIDVIFTKRTKATITEHLGSKEALQDFTDGVNKIVEAKIQKTIISIIIKASGWNWFAILATVGALFGFDIVGVK